MWRDVHAAEMSCTAALSVTSAICREEVLHQGSLDDESCCEPRDQSPSEKRSGGNDAADLEEQRDQKLLVRCSIVMEACSIMTHC